MAHIGEFKINKSDGYIKLEDVIKETITDFVFEEGKTYQISFDNTCIYCVKQEKPSTNEGFRPFLIHPYPYTQPADAALYVKSLRKTLLVNIAE